MFLWSVKITVTIRLFRIEFDRRGWKGIIYRCSLFPFFFIILDPHSFFVLFFVFAFSDRFSTDFFIKNFLVIYSLLKFLNHKIEKIRKHDSKNHFFIPIPVFTNSYPNFCHHEPSSTYFYLFSFSELTLLSLMHKWPNC